MLCVASGVTVLAALAASGFTLSWTHSVARTTWWERWQITGAGLAPVEARITGAGAGMEPPSDATFRDGAWHFVPQIGPQQQVILAASGASGSGWRLCASGHCRDLPEDGHPLHLWTAPDCAGNPEMAPAVARVSP